MINIINRDCRELGSALRRSVIVELNGESCKYLRLFKGARLAVFMFLALHPNTEGWTIASLALLHKEAGYAAHAVARAIATLCKLKIDGHRVLLAVRDRWPTGTHARQHFRIFPSDADLLRFEGMVGAQSHVANGSALPKPRIANLTLI